MASSVQIGQPPKATNKVPLSSLQHAASLIAIRLDNTLDADGIFPSQAIMQLTFEFKHRPPVPGRIFWSQGAPEAATPVFVPTTLLSTDPKTNELHLNTSAYQKLWASINCGASPKGIGSHLFPDLTNPLKANEKELPVVVSFIESLRHRLFQLRTTDNSKGHNSPHHHSK